MAGFGRLIVLDHGDFILVLSQRLAEGSLRYSEYLLALAEHYGHLGGHCHPQGMVWIWHIEQGVVVDGRIAGGGTGCSLIVNVGGR